MRESDVEGLAGHNGPELGGGGGDTAAEALAGEGAGVVLSPEIRSDVSRADRLLVPGRQYVGKREGERANGSTGSETHCMYRSDLNGNRESLRPALGDCAGVRTANSKEAQL
jgi:hypothetical protein